MTIFDNIRALYLKTKINTEATTQENITLSKWLSFDNDNIHNISNILPYLFFIEPQHYYYLLWLNTPLKQKVPYLTKSPISEPKVNEIYEKIKHVLDWSDRELELNISLLSKTIMKNQNYWKKELGIK
jgi:hypothetical protein